MLLRGRDWGWVGVASSSGLGAPWSAPGRWPEILPFVLAPASVSGAQVHRSGGNSKLGAGSNRLAVRLGGGPARRFGQPDRRPVLRPERQTLMSRADTAAEVYRRTIP